MSAKKNLRLAYISSRLSDAESDSTIVKEVVKKYKVAESTARDDLKEVYRRWIAIDTENHTSHKAKFMEIGMTILNEMRANMAMGAVAAQFKTLAQMAGVLTDKVVVTDSLRSTEPAPAPNTVRSRIQELAKDPKIREKALKLGLDLDDITMLPPDSDQE